MLKEQVMAKRRTRWLRVLPTATLTVVPFVVMGPTAQAFFPPISGGTTVLPSLPPPVIVVPPVPPPPFHPPPVVVPPVVLPPVLFVPPLEQLLVSGRSKQLTR
jgi:hypothetical protein